MKTSIPAAKIAVDREIFRPARIAIVHGSRIKGTSLTLDIRDSLQMFAKLRIEILSIFELEGRGNQESFTLPDYDLIALVGEPDEFSILSKTARATSDAITLSFAPKTNFTLVKKYLQISDAVILCETNRGNWIGDITGVMHIFENLVVPSLLNIDIADVKRIAKGVGLALTLEDDDPDSLAAQIPKECLRARTALLHFKCKHDVSLKEIYSISKKIAVKKGVDSEDPRIASHSEAKKLIRKLNVKLGVRVIDEKDETSDEKRINLTALFFGIKDHFSQKVFL